MWARRLIGLVLGAALARVLHGRARAPAKKPALAARAARTEALPPERPSATPPPRRPERSRRRRLTVVGAVLALCALLAGATAALERGGDDKKGHSSGAGAIADAEASKAFPEPESATPHELASSPETAVEESSISPGAPSDAEVRRELRQLERYNRGLTSGSAKGGGELDAGLARPPRSAPSAVHDVIAGGNAIARFPYRLGGGHGSFVDDAYDCSGSVSYALAAAGMLDSPVDSGQLMQWGVPGAGRWVTVFANPGHVYMEVAGLRFDTSGRAGLRGSRWQASLRAGDGFSVRHWPGL